MKASDTSAMQCSRCKARGQWSLVDLRYSRRIHTRNGKPVWKVTRKFECKSCGHVTSRTAYQDAAIRRLI